MTKSQQMFHMHTYNNKVIKLIILENYNERDNIVNLNIKNKIKILLYIDHLSFNRVLIFIFLV